MNIQNMYNCTLDSLRGYNYKLPNSIINCPHFLHGGILFPLANSLQFYDGKKTKTIYQSKRQIAALDMRGHWIGIGERASPGQLISAVLLDTREPEAARVFNYQKTQINHIAIGSNGEFFCSVGSSSEAVEDLIVIETSNQSEVGTKVFFSKSYKKSGGPIRSVKFSNNDPYFFVLLQTNKVTFFRIDPQSGDVEETVARTSRVREYNNFIFSPDDAFLYACSKNGDVSEISIEEGKETRVGPRRRVITKGILNLKWLMPHHLVISGSQGMMALLQLDTMKLLRQIKFQGEEIVSLSEFDHSVGYVATNRAFIYRLSTETFDSQLFYTCCSTRINSIAFLRGYSEIFGTCSGGEIMIWKNRSLAPALRIMVEKVTCLALHFPKNGKYIVSGWSDDCVRIFSPKNGKLLHRIPDCNLGKVNEVISDEDSTQIICGGENGVIRLWNLVESRIFGLILGALAHHMQRVNCLTINPHNHDQLVSCCDDGCYAVWSLSQFSLRHSFRVANFLKDLHFVDEMTIRMAGSGGVIYQCFASDGIIRKQMEVIGTCVNALAECYVDSTGERLLIFGGDCPQLAYFDLESKGSQIIKVEAYGEITCIAVSPDKKNIIAATANGIILSYSVFAVKHKEEDSQ